MNALPKFPHRAAAGALIVACLLVAVPAAALDGWSHAHPVTVTNPGAALDDYQVRVDLDGGFFDFGAAAPYGADLRVTATDGETLLPFWLETWNPGTEEATLWVRVTDLGAGENRELLLWSGNPVATPAGDGAATFLFYSGFEELAGLSGMNAPDPLVTPTYDGSGQVVHPDVVHVPGGWNGYTYWMGMTPYPGSNDDWENPSVLASNDNVTWVVPPGLTNPLAPEPDGHNDDVDMLLVGDEMVLYYVETNNDGNSYITRFASTDGADWGAPQVVLTIPNYVMSPAVVHEQGTWTMWYARSPGGCTSSYQDVVRRTSADGIAWGPEEAITLIQSGWVPWHFDVQVTPAGYTMLFISYPDGSSCGNTQLYHAESVDGLVWTVTPEPILRPSADGWDNANIYRASFTIAGDFLRIWYSARSTGNQWRVGYTEGDLDDFNVEDPGTWSEIHGDAVASAEHARTGTYGLRLDGGGTYPQVFGSLSGEDVCINVWYREDLSAATDFMALLRMWDSDTSVSTHHCIGTGIWTGNSTTHYSYHSELFTYTATALPRSTGWRHLAIAATGGSCELSVDGAPVATLDVLDPALIDRFSVEGYRGGTGFFDDAYVRRHVQPEPTAAVGTAIVSGTETPSAAGSRLAQNVPNPLNPSTRIRFVLDREGPVTLAVYDLRGRLVRTLVDGHRAAGPYDVSWDGRDGRGEAVAGGVYLYLLRTEEGIQQRKMTLLK